MVHVNMNKVSLFIDAPRRLRHHRGKPLHTYRVTPLGASVCLAIVIIATGSVFLTYYLSQTSHHLRGRESSALDTHPEVPAGRRQQQLYWCSSVECRNRLEELKSKLSLEEDIFQQQLEYERHRTRNHRPYKHYTRREIVRQVEKDIKSDLQSNKEKYPDQDDYDFEPDEKWIKDGSFPDINVVGNLKTGSSQLYNIFATHRDVVNIADDWKEHCMNEHYGEKGTPQYTYQYGLYAWHEFYYNRKVPGKKQVNGCLETEDLELRLVYNPPQNPDTKFFVLLRDPVDWAWSAYNFWTNEGWDTNHDNEDNWVKDAQTHYRSPEAFHEAILSGGKMSGMEDIQEDLIHTSVDKLRRLTALVGRENLVVLKNEDLTPGRIRESGLFQKIVEATGLAMDGFDDNILQSRTNCNANKGMKALCSELEYEHRPDNTTVDNTSIARTVQLQSKNVSDPDTIIGASDSATLTKASEDGQPKTPGHSRTVGYPVTHYRPMLEATRRFIYLQWHKECKIWADEFGVEYPECLAAIPDS